MVERREAQRRRIGPRKPGAGRRARREAGLANLASVRRAGGASQAPPKRVSQTLWRLPALHPLGDMEKGVRLGPGLFKQQGRSRMPAEPLAA